jgi:hypothetical protein
MSRHESHDWPCWDEALPARVDVVVRNWSTAIAATDPWDNMLRDDVTGEVRAVAAALINAACDDEDARRRRIAGAAYAHGLFRRAQRFPKRLLSAELVALREAIRVDLQSGYWSATLVDQAIDGLVADLRLARHRAERAFDVGPDASVDIATMPRHPES